LTQTYSAAARKLVRERDNALNEAANAKAAYEQRLGLVNRTFKELAEHQRGIQDHAQMLIKHYECNSVLTKVTLPSFGRRRFV
jgi:hypothetical protein